MICFPAHSCGLLDWEPQVFAGCSYGPVGKFAIWLLASISNEAREQEVAHKMEANVFCSLMLEVTSHRSCCILLEACHSVHPTVEGAWISGSHSSLPPTWAMALYQGSSQTLEGDVSFSASWHGQTQKDGPSHAWQRGGRKSQPTAWLSTHAKRWAFLRKQV